MLDLLHDRCRPSCHYHTERKNKNHAWTLLQGPAAAVSGRVQPGDGSLPGQWEPHWARDQGSSLHQCPRVRGWCRGAESRNPLWGGSGEPRGAVQAYWSVQCRSAAAAPRGWLGSIAWAGDDVMGDWKMPLLWCQRRHQIGSPRRHNPIWTSEIAPVPLEARTFFSRFISSCSFFWRLILMPLVWFIFASDSNNYRFFHLGISAIAGIGIQQQRTAQHEPSGNNLCPQMFTDKSHWTWGITSPYKMFLSAG